MWSPERWRMKKRGRPLPEVGDYDGGWKRSRHGQCIVRIKHPATAERIWGDTAGSKLDQL